MFKSILLVETKRGTSVPQSLQQCCRTLHRASTEDEMLALVSIVDAVVMNLPHKQMLDWQSTISGIRRLPIIWLVGEANYPAEMDWGFTLDGVIFPSMTKTEMLYAIKWALRTHNQRRRWSEEREQLLQRLEERKWIDQAKAVLCEIKGISEAEAYDFLRKQAMNERKRIGDIAASIVKVYQLIHG